FMPFYYSLLPPRSHSCPYTTLFRSTPVVVVPIMTPTRCPPYCWRTFSIRVCIWLAACHNSRLLCVSKCAGVSAGSGGGGSEGRPDRKSTRLNSSHVKISYAVFFLKK